MNKHKAAFIKRVNRLNELTGKAKAQYAKALPYDHSGGMNRLLAAVYARGKK